MFESISFRGFYWGPWAGVDSGPLPVSFVCVLLLARVDAYARLNVECKCKAVNHIMKVPTSNNTPVIGCQLRLPSDEIYLKTRQATWRVHLMLTPPRLFKQPGTISLLRRFNIAGSNKTFFGSHKTTYLYFCPISNKFESYWHVFMKSHPFQISGKSVQATTRSCLKVGIKNSWAVPNLSPN